MNLESQIDMYLTYVAAANTESTVAAYRSKIGRWERFVNNRRVTKDLAREWQNDLLNDGLSKKTVMLCRQMVRSMYHWLIENELATLNPIGRVKECPSATVERPVMSLEEYERILVVADKDKDEDWPYAVRCGWETGLRISDVTTLAWPNVLWAERGIRCTPRKTTRFNKIVEIPLADTFLAFLMELHLKQGRPVTGYIAPNMASQYFAEPKFHSDAFIRLAAKALVFKGFHSLRHQFCTRMLSRGVGAEIISTMTGQTIEQVMQYQHVTLESKRKLMGLDPIVNQYQQHA